jgi:hypothetical protein
MSEENGLLEATPYQNSRPTSEFQDMRVDAGASTDEPQETVKTDSLLGSTQDSDNKDESVNWEKRYKDLQSYSDKRVAELEKKLSGLAENTDETSAEAASDISLPNSDEELAKFKEDYPDIYQVVERLADRLADSKTVELQQQLEQLQGKSSDLSKQNALATIKEAHPDFNDIIASDDFKAWSLEQPAQVKEWIYNNPDNASLAIKALNLYKLETNKTSTSTPKPKPDTSGADAVKANSQPVTAESGKKLWSVKEISKMRPDEFDKYQDEINRAYAEGRITP